MIKKYINSKKKAHEEKKVRRGCNSRCRLKCNEKITTSQRQKIHEDFWKLTDPEKVQSYHKHISKNPVQSRQGTEEKKS